MRKNFLRRGAPILAAVAVVVGGLTIGAGAAGASCNVPVDCGVDWWFRSGTVENVTVNGSGDYKVARGNATDFSAGFSASGNPDRSLTKIVYHVPAELVFQAVRLEQLAFDGAETTRETLPTGAVTTDRAAGTVTIDAPAGGWQLPQTGAGNVRVEVDYKAPRNASLSRLPIGLTFEVSGIDGPQGWAHWADTSIVRTPQEEQVDAYVGSVESQFDYASSFSSADIDFGSLATGSETGSN
ncbi:hypothetical protein [Rhodococcus sp. NPDC004095]